MGIPEGTKLGSPKLKGVAVTEADAAIIARLPKNYQKALSLTGDYKSRAAQLNVPIGTVKSRLNRARAAREGADDAIR